MAGAAPAAPAAAPATGAPATGAPATAGGLTWGIPSSGAGNSAETSAPATAGGLTWGKTASAPVAPVAAPVAAPKAQGPAPFAAPIAGPKSSQTPSVNVKAPFQAPGANMAPGGAPGLKAAFTPPNPTLPSLYDQAAGKTPVLTPAQTAGQIASDVAPIWKAPLVNAGNTAPVTVSSVLNAIFGQNTDHGIPTGGIIGSDIAAWNKVGSDLQGSDVGMTPTQKVAAVGQNGYDLLMTLFAPIGTAFQEASTIPGPLGGYADFVNRIFSSAAAGGGDATVAVLNASNALTPEQKTTLTPIVKQLGALAAQIALGKATSDMTDELKTTTNTMLTQLFNKSLVTELSNDPAMQAYFKNNPPVSDDLATMVHNDIAAKAAPPAVDPEIQAMVKGDIAAKAAPTEAVDPKIAAMVKNDVAAKRAAAGPVAAPEPYEVKPPEVRGTIPVGAEVKGKVTQLSSNNASDNMPLEEARSRIAGTEQQQLVNTNASINEKYGAKTTGTRNFLGDTENYGTENAVREDLETDAATSRKIAAEKVLAHVQNTVINFVHDPSGPDELSTMTFPKRLSLADLRNILTSHGLKFRSIDQDTNTVQILDKGKADSEVISDLANEYDTKVTTETGHGEFIGSDVSREAAAANARAILDGTEKVGGHDTGGEAPGSETKGTVGGQDEAGSGNANNGIPDKEQSGEESGGKTSKIARSIQVKAIDAKLTDGSSHLAQYDPVEVRTQAEMAADVVNAGIENARAMIRGEIPLPHGLNGVSLIAAMEDYLERNPSSEVAEELMNSPLITGTSEAAQTMRLAQERNPDSVTAKAQELKEALEKNVEKKTGKTIAKAKADTIKNDFQKIVKKERAPRQTWEDFAKNILSCPI